MPVRKHTITNELVMWHDEHLAGVANQAYEESVTTIPDPNQYTDLRIHIQSEFNGSNFLDLNLGKWI